MTRLTRVPQANAPPAPGLGDVEALVSQLDLDEKISLLSGQGSFKTTEILERGIPAIIVRFFALIQIPALTPVDI